MIVGDSKSIAVHDRRVPIHNCILPLIEKRMQNKHLMSMSQKEFTNKWYDLLGKLGIEKTIVHQLRHDFSRQLIEAGIKEDIVKSILGLKWTNSSYIGLDEVLIEAIDKVAGRE